jgi:hypothetical protein
MKYFALTNTQEPQISYCVDYRGRFINRPLFIESQKAFQAIYHAVSSATVFLSSFRTTAIASFNVAS